PGVLKLSRRSSATIRLTVGIETPKRLAASLTEYDFGIGSGFGDFFHGRCYRFFAVFGGCGHGWRYVGLTVLCDFWRFLAVFFGHGSPFWMWPLSAADPCRASAGASRSRRQT